MLRKFPFRPKIRDGEIKRSIQGTKFDNLNALTKYLKELYSPANTVHQVRRELENEDIITFINRVPEIENRIIEAY